MFLGKASLEDPQGRYNDTALSAAVRHGHEGCMLLLANLGSDARVRVGPVNATESLLLLAVKAGKGELIAQLAGLLPLHDPEWKGELNRVLLASAGVLLNIDCY
jgi:hypothetical protein